MRAMLRNTKHIDAAVSRHYGRYEGEQAGCIVPLMQDADIMRATLADVLELLWKADQEIVRCGGHPVVGP